MSIDFKPLTQSDFPLLLKWLETLHVKQWWDSNIKWTAELIAEKYSSYVENYKKVIIDNKIVKKPIYAFIIIHNGIPIGYIQHYNIYDFIEDFSFLSVDSLPKSCASLDFYIGNINFIGKKLGHVIVMEFYRRYIFPTFNHIILTVDSKNIIAIRTYGKAGFKILKEEFSGKKLMFLSKNTAINL